MPIGLAGGSDGALGDANDDIIGVDDGSISEFQIFRGEN